MNKGDEEKFVNVMAQLEPLMAQANELMKEHKHMLQSQRFALDANSQIIQKQQKEISDNRVAIEESKGRAASIISNAEIRAKEIEKGMITRIAETSHRERESEKKLTEIEKMLWEVENKQSRKSPKAA